MSLNEDRERRLSDLGKAAIGIGATVAFFTHTNMGRNLATDGVRVLSRALSETAEELQDKTIKNTWGKGIQELGRAKNAFVKGIQEPLENLNKLDLPVHQNNLLGAIQKKLDFARNGEKEIEKVFNKEVMPRIYRDAIRSSIENFDDSMENGIREVTDDIMNRTTKNILSHGENGSVVFAPRLEQKISAYFGTDKERVTAAIKSEFARFDTHRDAYMKGEGTKQFNAVKAALENYESYEKRYKNESFFTKSLSNLNPVRVRDIITNEEEFVNKKVLGEESLTYIEELKNMVNKDNRFNDLVIDSALRINDKGVIYNYDGIRELKNKAEDSISKGVGRIFKPLSVHRNKRNAPNFFYIPKGSRDPILAQATMGKQNDLDHAYLSLFGSVYQVHDNALKRMKKLDNIYFTPSNEFEGSMLRNMTGNVDTSKKERNKFQRALGLSKTTGLTPFQKLKSKFLPSKNYPSSYSGTAHAISNALTNEDPHVVLQAYNDVYNVAGDLVAEADREIANPSRNGINKVYQHLQNGFAKQNFKYINMKDSELLEALESGTLDKLSLNNDLDSLLKTYKRNPLETLGRTFYHGDTSNNLAEELRRELIKNATLSQRLTDVNLTQFSDIISDAGLSEIDQEAFKQLGFLGLLQKATSTNLKAPNVRTHIDVIDQGNLEAIANLFSGETTLSKEFEQVMKPLSRHQAKKAYEERFFEAYNNHTVEKAYRPNEYIAMRKSVNILDIIQNLNDGQKVVSGVKQFFAGGSNLDDVTNSSLYPYFALFRLTNGFKNSPLNFSPDNTTNVLELGKNIITKRALPIYGAMYGLSYLNYEMNNFTGHSLKEIAAESTAKLDLGLRQIADIAQGPLKDAYYWFTPLNYASEQEYQTAEERKEWYEKGYSPVRQGKFWQLGSSEFFGGKILYHQPNYVKRAQTEWRDIGVYGSSEDKWKHSLLPTPRHPLSTIRYLMNPYWLEEKHKFDRPYMVSGSMFDPNTPWGTIGNLTIGQIVKPQKRLNTSRTTRNGIDIRTLIEIENERVRDKARSKENTVTVMSDDSALENVSTSYSTHGLVSDADTGNSLRTGGLLGASTHDSSGAASYILKSDRRIAAPKSFLSRDDQKTLDGLKFTNMRSTILNQLEDINIAIKDKAKWSYGNDVAFAKDITNAAATSQLDLIRDSSVKSDLLNLDSTRDRLLDLNYSISQLSGLYGFVKNSILPPKKTYGFARSSDMTSLSNRFWQTGIDGADAGGIMEILRRFIPHEDRNRIRINPIRNTMPHWLPERFRFGDPYTMVKKGEMRLPGAAYEALYGIEDPFELTVGPSAVGKSQEDIIQAMIGSRVGINQKLLESADEGTALHEEYEQILKTNGLAITTEGEIRDDKNGIHGFYDVLLRDDTAREGRAIMDIKTVSDNVYNQVAADGAKQEHLAQTNYYLGMTDLSKGYVMYINRDNPEQIATYSLNFSETLYRDSLRNVKEARKKVLKLVKGGKLSAYDFYDDFTRFKILADVAPGSAEYKSQKKVVESSLNQSQEDEYRDILNRVEQQSKRHRFFNYRFVNVDLEHKGGVVEQITRQGQVKLIGDDNLYSLAGLDQYAERVYDYLAPGTKVRLEYEKVYNKQKNINAAFYANGMNVNRQMMRSGDAERKDDGTAMSTRALLEKSHMLMGAPFEILSHMPIPYIHNKFLRVNTPYESWVNENIYGTKYSSWNNPIDTMVKPALNQAWGSNYWQGLLGTALFGLNAYTSDLAMTRGNRLALNVANLAFTPGAFLGEMTERVGTLNFNKATSGTGMRLGSVIGLTGFMINHSENPLFSAASGAGLGYLVGDYLRTGVDDVPGLGKMGSFIGTVAGLALTGLKTDGFHHDKLFKKWIPGEVEKRWDMEEYFDRLEYLKYKGLYEKTARLAESKEGVNIKNIFNDFAYKEANQEKTVKRLMQDRENVLYSDLPEERKQILLKNIDQEINAYINPSLDVPATPYTRLAIGYKQAMESTVYALDENSSWSQILRALEPYERDYFMEFAKVTNPKEQKKILETVSPYKQKILKNLWGMKPKKQRSNSDYFKYHRLPGFLWKGWNADKDIENYKVKTIMNEGMQLSDFGYYDSEREKPEVQKAKAINYDNKANMPLMMHANLLSVMQGLGITNGEVRILPSQTGKIETFMNLTTQNYLTIKKSLGAIGNIFY